MLKKIFFKAIYVDIFRFWEKFFSCLQCVMCACVCVCVCVCARARARVCVCVCVVNSLYLWKEWTGFRRTKPILFVSRKKLGNLTDFSFYRFSFFYNQKRF